MFEGRFQIKIFEYITFYKINWFVVAILKIISYIPMKNSIRSVIIIAGLLVSYDEVSHILQSISRAFKRVK